MELQKDNEDWKQRRLKNLTSENGWLTLCGLHWLEKEDEPLTFGSDSSNYIVLPKKTHPVIGTLTLKNGIVTMRASNGIEGLCVDGKKISSDSEIVLRDDDGGSPNVVSIGIISFTIIKRSGKLAVRARDKESPTRVGFKGISYFPYDPKWRLDATWIPNDPPKELAIVNVFGMKASEKSSGSIQFEIDSKQYKLDTVDEEGANELFIIFKDLTAGHETYGFRYLYASYPDKNNHIILDFNRAYNPPCSYTDYATCSMPHEQNRLQIKIEAGEKKPDDH